MFHPRTKAVDTQLVHFSFAFPNCPLSPAGGCKDRCVPLMGMSPWKNYLSHELAASSTGGNPTSQRLGLQTLTASSLLADSFCARAWGAGEPPQLALAAIPTCSEGPREGEWRRSCGERWTPPPDPQM